MSVQDEIEITGEPAAVYRLYDARSALLYVGMTHNIAVRFAQHAIDKTWWPLVTRKTMIWYGSRPEAATAEMAVILTESPLHNFEGKSSEDEYGIEAMRRRDKITMPLTHVVRSEPRTTAYGTLQRAQSARPAVLPPLAQERVVRDSDLQRQMLVYVTVADKVASKIKNGAYPPGSRLPGERELAAEYEVALGTVRRALQEMRERGHVVTTPSKGTFITSDLPSQ